MSRNRFFIRFVANSFLLWVNAIHRMISAYQPKNKVFIVVRRKENCAKEINWPLTQKGYAKRRIEMRFFPTFLNSTSKAFKKKVELGTIEFNEILSELRVLGGVRKRYDECDLWFYINHHVRIIKLCAKTSPSRWWRNLFYFSSIYSRKLFIFWPKTLEITFITANKWYVYIYPTRAEP